MKRNKWFHEKGFDSAEEYYFNEWLLELKTALIIIDIAYQPETIELLPKVNFLKPIKKKTKTKIVKRQLLAAHSYTPDFLIQWNWRNKKVNLFTVKIEEFTPKIMKSKFLVNEAYQSVIDVKGTFGKYQDTIRFSLEQKLLWYRYKIYVQKIIPFSTRKIKGLFENTFTPKAYLFTTKTKKQRRISWEVRTLKEFLQEGD